MGDPDVTIAICGIAFGDGFHLACIVRIPIIIGIEYVAGFKAGVVQQLSDKLESAEAVIASPILHISDSDSIPANIFLTTFIA